MATQLSNSAIVFILNGHRFSGFADEDPPVDFEVPEIATANFGKDGGLYTNDTGKRGGELTVKLLPASPSTKWMMRNHSLIKTGSIIHWSGTYSDPNLSYHSVLRGGVLTKAPNATPPGQNAEFMFVFEEIIPDYDSARFSASIQADLPSGVGNINIGVSI